MSRMRWTFVRSVLLWTLMLLAIGVLLAAQAAWSLYHAQQVCFFNYPRVPCPGADDPAVARLTFAFIGVPLIWLGGIAIAAVARIHRRRRPRIG